MFVRLLASLAAAAPMLVSGWDLDPSFAATAVAGHCVSAPAIASDRSTFQATQGGIVKRRADGSLDPAWANAGQTAIVSGTTLRVMPDGGLLVITPFSITRLGKLGGRVETFGDFGTAVLPAALMLHSLAEDADGGWILATVQRTGTPELAFMRLDRHGRVDAGFGNRGTNIDAGGEALFGWSLLSDGSLEVGIATTQGAISPVTPRVTRFTGTGFPRVLEAATPRRDARASWLSPAVSVQPDGSVVFAGEGSRPIPEYGGSSRISVLTLTRIRPDGTLDRGFGNGGVATADVPPPYAWHNQSIPHSLVMGPRGEWTVHALAWKSGGSLLNQFRGNAAVTANFAADGTAQGLVVNAEVGVYGNASMPITRVPDPMLASPLDDGAYLVSLEDGGRCTLGKARNRLPRTTQTLVEYHHPGLDHYFITLEGLETAILDGDPAHGWIRTGRTFGAWMALPIEGTRRTCRFYGDLRAGPNSHFYVPEGQGCDLLMMLAAQTPEGAKAWRLEGLTFSVVEAAGGDCAPNLTPVRRAYNRGFERGVDSNHRYFVDPAVGAEMQAQGWIVEGIAFCVPAPVAAPRR